MMTKLKMLSMAALAAIAASTTSVRAATVTVTNATVWNDITVQFTVFAQASPYLSTNKAGTSISAKTTQSAFTTKTLLEAVAADTGDGFNPATSKLVSAKSYADTNVYTVVDLLTMRTNYYDLPYFAGLSNEVYLTIATNPVFTNIATQLEVVDAANNVYPLTNGHFGFTFSSYTLNGSENAVGGVPITGTEKGTAYGIGSLQVDAVTNWVFSSSGYGTATVSPMNLQTSKDPLYVDIRSSSSAVAGAGTMGGTLTTNIDGVADIPTNYTIVVVKGTLTESFWKFMVNQ